MVGCCCEGKEKYGGGNQTVWRESVISLEKNIGC